MAENLPSPDPSRAQPCKKHLPAQADALAKEVEKLADGPMKKKLQVELEKIRAQLCPANSNAR
jgi:hypothetical protein